MGFVAAPRRRRWGLALGSFTFGDAVAHLVRSSRDDGVGRGGNDTFRQRRRQCFWQRRRRGFRPSGRTPPKGAAKRKQHGCKGSHVFPDRMTATGFGRSSTGTRRAGKLHLGPEVLAIFQEAGLQGPPKSAGVPLREHTPRRPRQGHADQDEIDQLNKRREEATDESVGAFLAGGDAVVEGQRSRVLGTLGRMVMSGAVTCPTARTRGQSSYAPVRACPGRRP